MKLTSLLLILIPLLAFSEQKRLISCKMDVEGGGVYFSNSNGVILIEVHEGGFTGGSTFKSEFEIENRKNNEKCYAEIKSKPNAQGSYFNLKYNSSDKQFFITSFNLKSDPVWLTVAQITEAGNLGKTLEEITEIPIKCKIDQSFEKVLSHCE